jgi:hypothetical protein
LDSSAPAAERALQQTRRFGSSLRSLFIDALLLNFGVIPQRASMKRIAYRDWIVEADPDATRNALSITEPMGPSTCSCANCRNFLAARELGIVYPTEVVMFLREMGLDPIVETEIAPFGREPSGMHVVSGWAHAVGRIVAGPEARMPSGADGFTLHTTAIEGAFELALLEGKALAPPSLRDQELIQIEFLTRLPWLLAEPDPELSSVSHVV